MLNDYINKDLSYIEMREFVRQYIPQGWKECLEKVMYIPYWTETDYNNFKANFYPGLYNNPKLIEAIKSYFNSL